MNHKILDLAGDFVLSGYRIIGKVICYQGGHELTNLFLRKLFNTESTFQLINQNKFVASNKIQSEDLEKIAVNA